MLALFESKVLIGTGVMLEMLYSSSVTCGRKDFYHILLCKTSNPLCAGQLELKLEYMPPR